MTQGKLVLMLMLIPVILYGYYTAWLSYKYSKKRFQDRGREWSYWREDPATRDPYWYQIFTIIHILAFCSGIIAFIILNWNKPLETLL